MIDGSPRVRTPRIAIYSQDGLGLGHMRRTNSIASQFLRLRPEASALTLSDSQLGQFFEKTGNHDYLKLPSIVKIGPGDWRAVNLSLDFPDVLAMRQELIRTAVLSFSPDILLVDHMPHGAMGELLPTLEALRAKSASTRIVLGLRDILDSPQVIEQQWRSEGAFEAIERYYDRVLIYGMRQVFDVAEEYHFPSSIRTRLHYCGYVCSQPVLHHPGRLRARYLRHNADSHLIVGMAGGGADAYPLMRALLDAIPVTQTQGHSYFVLITGPFMPAHLRNDLSKRAQNLPARVLTSVDDPLNYMAAADLVIAMAGYNTTTELLSLRKRALLIPRAGPSAEQRTRACLFAERQWVQALDPDSLSAESLAHMILHFQQAGPEMVVHNPPDLQGINRVAEHLLALLAAPGRSDQVAMPVLVQAAV